MLIAGINSYITLAEADAYLGGSIQAAAAWGALDDATKELALISAHRSLEREAWEGVKSDVRQVASAVITAAGTGYAVGDVLEFTTGVAGVQALVEVLTVGGGGEVQTFKLLHTGFYTTDPDAPAPMTSITGAGINATLTATMVDQIMEWPRDLTVCDDYADQPIDKIPTDIQAAQAELAFIFSQDPAAEGNVGASSSAPSDNIKKVEAGSAKVTYFRPGNSPPYPTITWQLIKGYREGACGTGSGTGMAAFGTGDASAFTCPSERYGLNRGYA